MDELCITFVSTASLKCDGLLCRQPCRWSAWDLRAATRWLVSSWTSSKEVSLLQAPQA